MASHRHRTMHRRRWLIRQCAAGSVLLVVAAILRTAEGQQHRDAAAASIPGGLDQEIRRVEREVDTIEQQALAEWRALPITSSTRMNQVRLLGKLLLFD